MDWLKSGSDPIRTLLLQAKHEILEEFQKRSQFPMITQFVKREM